MRLLESLAAKGVRCWLDSGSLLGMVRNGHLNAWEKDIDLGIWADDLQATVEGCRRFAEEHDLTYLELRLQGLPYVMLIEDKSPTPTKTLPISVHVFYRLGKNAWSPQPHSLIWAMAKYPRHRLRERFRPRRIGMREALMFTQDHPRHALSILLAKLHLTRAIGLWMKSRSRRHWQSGRHLSDGALGGLLFDLFQWIVPTRFYDDLRPLPGHPHVLAPAPTDEYLALRYGNWRVPVQRWFYLVDDGCVFPMSRERLGQVKSELATITGVS